MTCDEFIERIDRFLCRDIGHDVADSLARHAAACRSCRPLWERTVTIADVITGETQEELDAARMGSARSRLRTAYADAGRPGVRFTRVDTPIGALCIGLSDRGVCDVALGGLTASEYQARLVRRAPEAWQDDQALEPVVQELRAYFEGKLRSFSVPVDLRSVSPFTGRVLQATRRIPFGRLVSYGKLASEIGDPKASRAVGGALGRNPVPIIVPCHRVVAQGGRIGGYTGGLETKRALLRLEGALEMGDLVNL